MWLSYSCCGNYNFLFSKGLLYVLLCCIIWRVAGNKIAAVNPSARRVIRGSRAELCLQVGSAWWLLSSNSTM